MRFLRLLLLFSVCLVFLSANPRPGSNVAPPVADSLVSDAELRALFAGDGVDHNDFARKVFYSWTTGDQVELLEKDALLLFKKKADDGAKSVYDVTLADHRFDRSPAAQILRLPAFERKRYAWVNPWATLNMFAGEDYGLELLEIEVEDSAYVIGFFPREKEQFRVFEANGKFVPMAEALKHPGRWAVVFHENQTLVSGWGKTKHSGTRFMPGKKFTRQLLPFREYIIINERLVKKWSHATPALRDKLAHEMLKFRRLELYLQQHGDTAKGEPMQFDPGYNGKRLLPVWEKGCSENSLECLFWRGSAFAGHKPVDDGVANSVYKDLEEPWKSNGPVLLRFPSKRYK